MQSNQLVDWLVKNISLPQQNCGNLHIRDYFIASLWNRKDVLFSNRLLTLRTRNVNPNLVNKCTNLKIINMIVQIKKSLSICVCKTNLIKLMWLNRFNGLISTLTIKLLTNGKEILEFEHGKQNHVVEKLKLVDDYVNNRWWFINVGLWWLCLN